MMTFPELETERLRLIEVNDEHAQGLFDNFSNPKVVQYYGMDPMTELVQAEKLVEHFRSSFATSHSIRWAIVRKEDDRFAGTIGLNNLSKGMKRAEIGFEIHPDFWRTGITSEALQEVVRYSFTEMGLRRMGAVTFLNNVASISLLEKHGFQQEGILRSYLFQNGQSHDARVFSVLSNQWNIGGMNLGNLIARGNTAEIYLHENTIVKVFNENLPDTESLYEANKQRFAYACGLPVPKVLDVTNLEGKQAITMEYVEGKTVGDLLFENRERAKYYLGISIDLQQEIHQIRTDLPEPMSRKLRQKLEAAPHLDKKQQAMLLHKLDSMTYENRLCHGDFHLFNLIMSDDKVMIIDWVDAYAGDIRADVCRTYLLYSQVSAELADLYLQMYCEKSGLLKEDILQWYPILAGARLAENVSSESTERLLDIVKDYCSID